MITLIGTGHIFNLNSTLNTLFTYIKPDLICVELDEGRFNTLDVKNKDFEEYLKKRKNLPILYKLFLRHQEKSAKKHGVSPGDEMIAAIRYAQQNNLPFELIDMDFQYLYGELMNSLKTSEKIKLSFLGVFLTLFGWYFNREEKIEKDLERLDKNFDKNMEKMQESYPIFKKIILDDRNEYMAKKIMNLRQNHKNIIACVGDGHIHGISRILNSNNVEFETVRLRSLMGQ